MGGSKGIGSRQRSEAPTITCTTNQAQAYELSNLSSELSHTRAHTHTEQCLLSSLLKDIQTKKKNHTKKEKVMGDQMFGIQIQGYFSCTSSSRKSTAASSSTVSFKGVLRNWISNWICWNPLRLKVWSRANSCKLLRDSFTIVDTTDSCSLQASSVHVVHIPQRKLFPTNPRIHYLCVFNFCENFHFLLEQLC